MKKRKVIYALDEADIQTVSLQELGRELTSKEIRKIIPLIENNVKWYEAIADSINERITSEVGS
jgi:hypothetical protein